MRMFLSIAVAAALVAPVAQAQQHGRPSPQQLIAAERDALKPLAWMDGVWRGTATNVSEEGIKHVVTQAERIGPMLDGSLKVMEGRGYNADGSVGFNAFAVLSWNMQKQAFDFRSYAMGFSGDMKFTPSADGYVWEIPAGPMTIRYTAHLKDGTWNEVGDRVMPGGKAVRFFEMNLKRVGDTTWPAGDPVPMR